MGASSWSGDAALVAAVAAGDETAFAALYGRYLPLVARWCLRETRNREVAADLAAEVFASSLTAARRYRAEQGSVAGWLLGIARNKLRESRRRKRVEDSARRRLGLEPIAITPPKGTHQLALASESITARRLGTAWLVVQANGTLSQRLAVLDRLRACVRLTGAPCPAPS